MEFKECKCSLDMVTLNVKQFVHSSYNPTTKFKVIGVSDTMEILSTEPGAKYWSSTRVTDYRHNFAISDYNWCGEECSFYFGVEHNSKRRSASKNAMTDVVIKYNPNKCSGSPILEYLLRECFYDDKHVKVKSIDIAIDIPLHINDLKPIVKGHRMYHYIQTSQEDITHYIGKRNSDGHIKIYNKAKEQGLKGVNLTRYEITLKPDMYASLMSLGAYNFNDKLQDKFVPIIQIGGYEDKLNKLKLNDTDKFILRSCIPEPHRVKELGRDKRKKIEQLLADNYSIEFDFKLITKVVSDYFNNMYKV